MRRIVRLGILYFLMMHICCLALWLWSKDGSVTHLRIDNRENNCAVYRDGKHLGTMELRNPMAGKIGIEITDIGRPPIAIAPQAWDNITVTDIDTGKILFTETFDKLDFSKWSVGSGTVSINDKGQLISDHRGTVYAGNLNWRNIRIEGDVMNPSETSLFFGVRNKDNLGEVKFRFYREHCLSIIINEDGKTVQNRIFLLTESASQSLRIITSKLMHSYGYGLFIFLFCLLLALMVAIVIRGLEYLFKRHFPARSWLVYIVISAACIIAAWIIKDNYIRAGLAAAGVALVLDWIFEGSINRKSWRFALECLIPLAFAVSAFTASAVINTKYLENKPHVQDSVNSLFQATLFSHGRLYADTPKLPEFFAQELIVYRDGRWHSHYPFVFPFLLMFGVFAGKPWLVNPLLSALAMIVIYITGRRMFNFRVALWASVFLISSPFFICMSASMMSHPAGLLLTLCTLLFCLKTLEKPSFHNTSVSALFCGLLLNTRPLTALAMYLSVSAIFLFVFKPSKSRFWKHVVLFTLIVALFAGLFLFYNYLLSG
ncbi:glycosyltransferase family 39 protein, partial [bacterium]|nr:glycosyltransferase family 39 protein [candidate division CSSED10-310 bacterium]